MLLLRNERLIFRVSHPLVSIGYYLLLAFLDLHPHCTIRAFNHSYAHLAFDSTAPSLDNLRDDLFETHISDQFNATKFALWAPVPAVLLGVHSEESGTVHALEVRALLASYCRPPDHGGVIVDVLAKGTEGLGIDQRCRKGPLQDEHRGAWGQRRCLHEGVRREGRLQASGQVDTQSVRGWGSRAIEVLEGLDSDLKFLRL